MTKQQFKKLARVYLVDNRKTTILGASLIWGGLGVISLSLPDSFEQLKHFDWRHFADQCFKAGCSIISGAGLIISKDAHADDSTGPVASTEGPIPESAIVPDEQFDAAAPKAD